jgi:hypothetical protein
VTGDATKYPFSEPDVHDDGGSGGSGALGRLLSNLCLGLDEQWQGGDLGSPSRSPTVTDSVNKKNEVKPLTRITVATSSYSILIECLPHLLLNLCG